MSASTPSGPVPEEFAAARDAVRSQVWRPQVQVHDLPSPQRIAPFALAIEADVVVDHQEVGTGRLVLLHDPNGNEAWEGTYRCVTFARADVDISMVTDPYLAEVGWSWLTDALEQRDASHRAVAGTVTSVASRSFGEMDADPDRCEVEIRASWTPEITRASGIAPHLEAWQDLLCMTAGLAPLPDGVALLTPRLRSGRAH